MRSPVVLAQALPNLPVPQAGDPQTRENPAQVSQAGRDIQLSCRTGSSTLSYLSFSYTATTD